MNIILVVVVLAGVAFVQAQNYETGPGIHAGGYNLGGYSGRYVGGRGYRGTGHGGYIGRYHGVRRLPRRRPNYGRPKPKPGTLEADLEGEKIVDRYRKGNSDVIDLANGDTIIVTDQYGPADDAAYGFGRK
ncbi:uncharacterized protein LOC141911439 [Tubulanus polymorphus]|uniref:uncharacterized protein LOC141911439 n=1 Tax=Tubulanus polymorphus TaxID=672921 RepID=UPI003DA46E78